MANCGKLRKYATLAVDMSYVCPSRCAHCLVDAHPENVSPQLSVEKAKHYIDMASDLGTMGKVSVGHQEPFQFFVDLFELARYVNRTHGYELAVMTSGFWARTYAIAYCRLSELQRCGLVDVGVSLDRFHESQVPMKYVVKLLHVSAYLGLNTTVYTVYTKNGPRSDHYRDLLSRSIDVSMVKWVDIPVIPIGRAASLDPSELPLVDLDPAGCTVFRDLHVGPDGILRPCNGTGRMARGLAAGSLDERSMSELAREMECNPVLNSLAIWGGPTQLIDVLRNERYGRLEDRKFTGPCHACHAILDDPGALLILREALATWAPEFAAIRRSMEDGDSG